MTPQFQLIIDFIRKLFKNQQVIPLHEPKFIGQEKEYVLSAIESTFVSSVGKYVNEFEAQIAKYVNSKFAVATVNATSALHLVLKVVGVEPDTEVITQPLSFVATVNPIAYLGAKPVFIDISPETLALDPQKLYDFLTTQTQQKLIDGQKAVINRKTGRRITACLPVHIYGFPAQIDQIVEICQKFGLPVVEDSAESLGSFYKDKHTGTFGVAGVFSFNGNKIITTGGGGMVVTDNIDLAEKVRHLSTQAKLPHPYEYFHDQIGYNYRLTNLQAALGLAQLQNLDYFIQRKQWLAEQYEKFFSGFDNIIFVKNPRYARSNYWLNTVIFDSFKTREDFIKFAHKNKVLVRPAWRLLNTLPMYKNCYVYNIDVASDLAPRIVNLPSSVI